MECPTDIGIWWPLRDRVGAFHPPNTGGPEVDVLPGLEPCVFAGSSTGAERRMSVGSVPTSM